MVVQSDNDMVTIVTGIWQVIILTGYTVFEAMNAAKKFIQFYSNLIFLIYFQCL